MPRTLINALAKIIDKDIAYGAWGTIVEETDHQVRILWHTGASTWARKRDVLLLD